MSRRLILLRHGQTAYNATNRMQGQLDTDLTDEGRSQAVRAAADLSDRGPSTIISSDLTRALDTATVLGEAVGLKVSTDERLRETHLGVWQGLTHYEVDAQYPGERLAWRADATMAPPGGESRVDVAARTVPVVREILADTDLGDGPAVLVAHGGTIAALTAALLDLPVDRWPVFGGLDNASWVQVTAHDLPGGPSWRLDVWNASARVASDVL